MNTTTNIIWVTGGLVGTHQLAEVIEKVESRELHIVKVPTVQDAIVELLKGELSISLIICDEKLQQSISSRNLFMAADTEEVPCLIAHEEVDGKQEVRLLARKELHVPAKSPLSAILNKFKIQQVDSVPICGRHCCA